MRDQGITRREATRLIVLGSCTLPLAGAGAWFTIGSNQPRSRWSNELEQVLEGVRLEHGLPGLAAAVVSGACGTVSGVAGVRRWRDQARLQLDDRFHIASCTKSMTAMLAAVAVHKGRLNWTTSLADGLPALAGKVRPEYRAATLEQLLAHEARMPPYTQPNAQQVEQMRSLKGTPAEQRLAFLVEVLGTAEPNHGTGNAAYSNVGYAAAGAMVETAAEVSWEELVRRELARPLGMKSVGFGYPASAQAPDQPRGHSQSGGGVVELPLDESRQLAVCLWPAGAVHCSIGDLAIYAADHLSGLRGRSALLPQAMYQRLHRTLDGGNNGFTLGWGVRPDERWGVTHFGAGSGGWFFVRIAIVPEHDAAVVAASNSGEAADATTELCTQLLTEFAPKKA